MGLSQFILVFAVKLPLNVFFGGIGSVQVVSFQNLCNIQHPANSHHFYKIIASVVNFDALDPKWTTKLFLDF